MPEKKEFKCRWCEKTFKTELGRKQHQTKSHKHKPFTSQKKDKAKPRAKPKQNITKIQKDIKEVDQKLAKIETEIKEENIKIKEPYKNTESKEPEEPKDNIPLNEEKPDISTPQPDTEKVPSITDLLKSIEETTEETEEKTEEKIKEMEKRREKEATESKMEEIQTPLSEVAYNISGVISALPFNILKGITSFNGFALSDKEKEELRECWIGVFNLHPEWLENMETFVYLALVLAYINIGSSKYGEFKQYQKEKKEGKHPKNKKIDDKTDYIPAQSGEQTVEQTVEKTEESTVKKADIDDLKRELNKKYKG